MATWTAVFSCPSVYLFTTLLGKVEYEKYLFNFSISDCGSNYYIGLNSTLWFAKVFWLITTNIDVILIFLGTFCMYTRVVNL